MTPDHERRAREWLTELLDQFSEDADNVASLTTLLTSVAAEARAEALEEAASLAARELGAPPLYAGTLPARIRALQRKETKP